MSDELYKAEINGPFASLCSGGDNSSGTMEDCLSIAPLEGGGFAVRDTKLGNHSPELRFSFAELMGAAEQIPGLGK